VGGSPFWVSLFYTLLLGLLSAYGLFMHQTTAPHQNLNYQPVIELTDAEDEDENLHDTKKVIFAYKIFLNG
jgi:hypothetical protein